MITRIHVNVHKIKSNAKHGTNDPIITVKRGRQNVYGHRVHIDGPCDVVYRPDRPLSCGARVWIETRSPVYVDETLVSVNDEELTPESP